MAETEEELKSLLMRVYDKSEKTILKLNMKKNKDHDIRSHYLMANRRGKVEAAIDFLFGWAPKSLQMVTAVMK